MQPVSNYTYDAIYELTQTVLNGSTSETYTYDGVGNWLSALGAPPSSYNSSNELTSAGKVTFTYDANGNTTSKTDSTGTTTYTWDFENRLTGVTTSKGKMASYKYDPFGRRVFKDSPTMTRIFVYDGDNIAERLDETGKATLRFTQGLGIDELLAMYQTGVASYYDADGLGSITSLTDATGAVANTYEYDSFGRLTGLNETVSNTFRYTGREDDGETKLYYYRARYYDPTLGRFLSEDPLRFKATTDFYPYVKNRPTGLKDPRGLVAWGTVGVSLVGVVGALGAAGGAQGSCLIVNDTQGNLGLLCCGGVGIGLAEGAAVGVQGTAIVCPTRKTICDLEGGFVQVEAFGGAGGGVAVGGGVSLSLNQLAIVGSAGPAGAVGGGAVVLGGSCKLVLGGKNCKKCPPPGKLAPGQPVPSGAK